MTPSDDTYLPGMAAPKTVKRRHELAADRTIRDARANGLLQTGHSDDALVTTLRAIARQLDVAEATDKPYATAVLSRELRELLVSARLDPGARTTAGPDPFTSLVTALNDDA